MSPDEKQVLKDFLIDILEEYGFQNVHMFLGLIKFFLKMENILSFKLEK